MPPFSLCSWGVYWGAESVWGPFWAAVPYRRPSSRQPSAHLRIEVQLHVAVASAAWVEEGLLQQDDLTVVVRGHKGELEAWVEGNAEAEQS